MTSLRVQPCAKPLSGSVPCAPDAETASLALALLALDGGGGRSRLRARGLPRLPIVAALAALGVEVAQHAEGCELVGRGSALRAPTAALDAQGSPAAIAALSALLAGQHFSSELQLDEPAARELLAGVVMPLRARGALVEGRLLADRPGLVLGPLRVDPAPGGALSPLQHQPAPRDWPGKTAALLSGLFADGPTLIQESVVSHERCERLLSALGLPIASAGPFVELDGQAWDGRVAAIDSALPGASGSAVALLAAGLLIADSAVTVRGVAVSGGSRGYLDALTSAGATLAIQATDTLLGEGVASLSVRGSGSAGLVLRGELAARAGASEPLLALLAVAARAGSESVVELSGDGSRLLGLLRAFGVEAELCGHELALAGSHGRSLRAARFDAAQDADLAIAATVLALAANGPCQIDGATTIVARFPRFVGSLRALGATIEVMS